MSWTKVGQLAFTIAAGASNETKTLPGTPAEGDIVVIAFCADTTTGNMNTAGYTLFFAESPRAKILYKELGSSPDSEVSITQESGNVQAGVIQIWRRPAKSLGDQVIDNNYNLSSFTSGMPNPTSHTTLTPNALRIIIGCLDDDDVASGVAAPSGYSNLIASDTGQASTTIGSTVMMASKEAATPGAENPDAFTGTGSDLWLCLHFALRHADPGGGGIMAGGL